MKLDTAPSLFETVRVDVHETTSHAALFKRLYYHLYSNSDASRAERIFADIAKLLLVKLIQDEKEGDSPVNTFLSGKSRANDVLMPLLLKRFPDLVTDDERFTIGDEGIRTGLADLSQINLRESSASILGDAFEALIGPRLRGDKGQFFTPRSLVRCMVTIADPKPADKVVDPAAGTGGFLMAAHAHRVKSKRKGTGAIIGLEKDRDISRLGAAMLQVATQGIGTILQANSLDISALPKGDASPFDADIVLTNPPFGVKIGVTTVAILREYELGYHWVFADSEQRWVKINQLRASQDPQILFLELAIRFLKPGGLLGIVLPEGVFGNRNGGYVWDYLKSVGDIVAMIDCPRTTFQPGTDTKTNVLFFKKAMSKTSAKMTAAIAVAKHCGHDRRGRSRNLQGVPIQDDFASISATFSKRAEPWWSECSFHEPYYYVPRFYHQGANRSVEQYAKDTGGHVVTLAELLEAKHLRIRKGNEVGSEAYGSGDIPFVRTSDVNNWEVSVDPTNGLSEEIYEQFKHVQKLKAGDILLVVDGRYKIGRSAILHQSNCRCVVQSHLRVLSVSESSPLTNYELLYLMNLPCVLDEMRNLVFIQSTLGSIGRRLERLCLPVPRRTAEWTAQIEGFRSQLEGRAELLSRLQSIRTPEPEL